MDETSFNTFFQTAPASVDAAAVYDYWQALLPRYDVGNWLLPLPPWQKRPYTDPGVQAWNTLCRDLEQSDPNKPFCIYLHAPFCSSKCGFCDSYSFKLGSHQAERIRDYVDRLCHELRLWSEQGNLRQRPVSTIHLGGGTPTFLGEAAMTRIIDCCRTYFSVSPDTELALESTSHNLTPGMIQTLIDLGFQRLHVGVQSLQDDVRQAIGRRSPSAVVLEKVEATRALGWVVSVDLVCGLPHQTLKGLIDDLERLIASGVNGFSLYELLIYPQNRRWCDHHGLTDSRRHLPNYWMFLAAACLLEARGFQKNVFNHWADARDANIYFTFPSRGEDLLAVGTIADGVFGDYHYRHPRYARYLESASPRFPGLEGGLRRDSSFNVLQPFITAIQSGCIPAELAAKMRDLSLPERWLACKLVRENGEGALELTPSGSWFAGNLIAELVLLEERQ